MQRTAKGMFLPSGSGLEDVFSDFMEFEKYLEQISIVFENRPTFAGLY